MDPPYSLSSQANSLVRSGSISFGRFENESLSWERHSSFSQNRYLEEVEKFSKPGSVTEKKAYFEAHFKKKGLMLQNSSLWQDGTEHQTHENNMLDDGMGNIEETKYANNEDSIHFDESPDCSECHEESQMKNFEGGNTEILLAMPQVEPEPHNVYCVEGSENQTCENSTSDRVCKSVESEYVNNENSHFDHFDKSPNDSGSHDESQDINSDGKKTVDPQVELASNHVYCAIGSENQTCESVSSVQMSVEIEYGNSEDSQIDHFNKSSADSGGDFLENKLVGKNTEIANIELRAAPASNKVDRVAGCVPKDPEPEKAHQTEIVSDKFLFVDVEQDAEVNQNLNNQAEIDNDHLKARDVSYRSREAEANGNLGLDHCQIPSSKEVKLTKPSKNSQTKLTGIRRSMFSESPKDSVKVPSRKESTILQRRPSQISSSATHSVPATLKAEESESLKVKLLYENKRIEKEAKKVVAPRPCTPEKFESRKLQTKNRFKHLVNLADKSIRQSATALNFRRDEPVESRKEELENLKAKLLHENKREKEFKAKKVVASRPSTPQKFESHGRLTTNRPMHILNPTGQDNRQSPAAFNFNSDNRTEKRKEEKTEAEIKQFRRSLNFRATPMPLFYREASLHESDHRKVSNEAVSANTVSAKSQSWSSGQRSKSVRAITPCSRWGGSQGLSQASKSTNGPNAEPETRVISPTTTNRSCRSQNEVAGKIPQEKKCNSSIQKHRISEGGSKVIKGQRTGEKQRVGTRCTKGSKGKEGY